MALTDAKIRNIKPMAKQIKHYNGGGLFLLCTPSGGKLWRFKYRYDGKAKGLALGKYPDVGLLDARQRKDDARRHLVNGVDRIRELRNEKGLSQEKLGYESELHCTHIGSN